MLGEEFDSINELEKRIDELSSFISQGLKLELVAFVSDYKRADTNMNALDKEYQYIKTEIKSDIDAKGSVRSLKSRNDSIENYLKSLSDTLNLEKQRTTNARERLKLIIPILERIEANVKNNESSGGKFDANSHIKAISAKLTANFSPNKE